MKNKNPSIPSKIFQDIIDAVPVLIFWTDTEHKVLGNNLKHAEAFGYSSPDELVGLSGAEVLKHAGMGKDIKEQMYNEHNQIIQSKTGGVFEYVLPLFNEKGEQEQETYILSYKYPLFDEKGNVIGLVGVSSDITDITKLKVTQQKLVEAQKKSEQVFQNIIDALPVLLFWTDTEHTILGNNLTHATTFGFQKSSELVDLPMSETFKNIDFYNNDDFINKMYLKHNDIMKNKIGEVIEYYGVFPNETERTYLSYKYPLLDEKDNVIGLVGVSSNITQLKKAQQELANAKKGAEEIFQKIIDALPLLLFWTNTDNVYTGSNLPHVKAFGFSSVADIIGKPLTYLFKNLNIDDALIDRVVGEHEEVMQSKKGKQLEYTAVMLDGQEHTWLSYKEPLINEDGEIEGLIGIAADITELKNAQKKAEMASKSKSEFIANMSHDIRTPISGVVGMAQDLRSVAEQAKKYLQDHREAPPSREQLLDKLNKISKVILQDSDLLILSTDELLRLCNEILETVSLETGHVNQKPESFDIHELLQRNINLLKPVAKNKKLNLTLEIAANVPRYLKGLRPYLGRTILNLTSNALKFTKTGFVKITAQIKESAPQPAAQESSIMLVLTVADSGVGIPNDKFEVIFEHFSRLTPSFEGIYKGSGLGLYTVKEYVKAMGGEISVKSELGKGSQFIVTAPLVVSDHSDYHPDSIRDVESLPQLDELTSPHVEYSDDIAAEQATPATYRILVVEDGAIAALAIARLLTSEYACAVDIAKTGQEGFAKAQANYYDLIFMDIGLPDMSGLAATQKIRTLPAPYSTAPIIALTGHMQEHDKCLAAGMQYLMLKPAQPQTVTKILQRYVFNANNVRRAAKKEQDSKTADPNNKAPLIDWAACTKVHDNDTQATKRLIAFCAKELKKTAVVLATAYETKNIQVLQQEIYRCLGSIVYLRLPRLEQALKAFDAAVKVTPHDPHDLEKKYEFLIQTMQDFFSECEKEGFVS